MTAFEDSAWVWTDHVHPPFGPQHSAADRLNRPPGHRHENPLGEGKLTEKLAMSSSAGFRQDFRPVLRQDLDAVTGVDLERLSASSTAAIQLMVQQTPKREC